MAIQTSKRCPCNGDNLERFIQPIILTILSRGSCSGYSVVKQLSVYPLLKDSPPDTTGVYRQLKQLEEKGNLRVVNYPDENGKIKKHYQITGEGLQCLTNWSQTLIDYRTNITMLIDDIEEVIS